MTRNVNLAALRTRAEKALTGAEEHLTHLDVQANLDLQELVQELRIYQTELEIQNQELVQSQVAEAKASEKYRGLYNGLPLPALLCDARGLIVEANQAALDFLHLRPASIQQRYSFVQFVEINSRHRVQRVLDPMSEDALPLALRAKIKIRDGGYVNCEIRPLRGVSDEDGRPLTLLVLVDKHLEEALARATQETTEALAQQRELNQRLESTQAQLYQSEKLASIGQLAAGVAHELNNPLGFVSSNLQTLDDYLQTMLAVVDACDEIDQDSPEKNHAFARMRRIKRENEFDYLRSDIVGLVRDTRDGVQRLSTIVMDLKNFARPGDDRWLKVDLHQNIESTLNIVWNELKYKVTLRKDYGPLPEVVCLPAQINQVLLNLLLNAGQAIDAKGEIVIRTRHEGDQVCVSITDNGSGIAPENLNRIFEPFFTTKPPGKGTGLGLMVCHTIVQRHAGHIDVVSTPGQGTVFNVWLPIDPPHASGVMPNKESS